MSGELSMNLQQQPAYGLDKKHREMKVAVYDLGGGTFDISILELVKVFSWLNLPMVILNWGDDFDERLMNWLAEEFMKEEGVDLRKDPLALQRLKEAAERAKIELSSSMMTEINLPYITTVDNAKAFSKTINKSKIRISSLRFSEIY